MDIDTLTDEVVRRLMIKIQKEQDAAPTACSPAVVFEQKQESTCPGASGTKKLVITDVQAANTARGSKITFPRGTIITPLARDTFKERGISYGFES